MSDLSIGADDGFPRTWLMVREDRVAVALEQDWGSVGFATGDRVRTIELEPVVELLERLRDWIGTNEEGTPWPPAQEIERLLAELKRRAEGPDRHV